jgi:hypothetical protein
MEQARLAMMQGAATWDDVAAAAAAAGVTLVDDREDVVIPPPRSLADRLVGDILDGLRVLNTLEGLNIDEDLLWARARNVAAGILANYIVTDHPNEENDRG